MFRNFEYRLYPTKKQEAILYSQFHLCTELHNILLTSSRENYEATGKALHLTDYNRHILELKRHKPEFKVVYSQVLQDVGHRLDKSFQSFFRRCKEKTEGRNIKVGYPRYKKLIHSITYPQVDNSSIRVEGNKLNVPKIGRIPIILHRPLHGKIKTLTIKRNRASHFYAVFSCETGLPELSPHQGPIVGMDQGLSHLLISSDGLVVDPPCYLRHAEKRLKKYQRSVSRKLKGSNNRNKARKRLAKAYLKVVNQRHDFMHQLSRRLVMEYSLIVIEDLQLNDLMKNHRVAKSFIDAGLGTLIAMLGYKASEAGSQIVKVNPAYTTQTCSRCGHIKEGNDRLTLGDGVYLCTHCGLDMDRDLNAAINILARAGLARSHACGDNVIPSLKKVVVAEAGTTRCRETPCLS